MKLPSPINLFSYPPQKSAAALRKFLSISRYASSFSLRLARFLRRLFENILIGDGIRNIAPILAGLLITLMAGVLIAHAAEINYAPLAPLPIGDAGAMPPAYTLSSYLSGMIKLLIALGAATAILFAIIGGTQYVAAGIAPSAKTDAKNRIMNAFIGLTIMLTSYLLLNSINPDLVNFNLELKSVATTTAKALGELNKWPDDTLIREELRGAGIVTNRDSEPGHGNCKKIGDTTCTSVAGLPRQAIDSLIALKYACSGLFTLCDVTISGGTEMGHETHGIGIPNVDLKTDDAVLNNFIITKGTHAADINGKGGSPKTGTATSKLKCGVSSAPHYYLLNASYTGTYVREPDPDHWHVCF